ncbi:DUF3068 domain-containing protein [Intrasporangium sp. DVR]|uniref:DUF3068 domain-containing protein n=1 Tax=Intrasporangium sp. DVR TaxID=3127867 RepID=UPI00313A547A
MRRIFGGIATALGTALVVVGFLANPYLYNQLATVPLDQHPAISESGEQDCEAEVNDCYTSRSEGTGMEVLRLWADAEEKAHYDKLTDAHVLSTRTVVGVPGEVSGDDERTAVWQTGVKSEAAGVGDLTYSMEVVTFDRVTGETTGSPLDVRSAGDLDDPEKVVPVLHSGQFFKFPFNAQKKTYQFWDGDLGQAVPIEFIREENLYGTETYVFQQSIPKTRVTTRSVPAGIFDATGENVDVEVMYANKRTLWVEPNTGVIVKGQEELERSLVSAQYGSVNTTKGTIGYNEKTVLANAETWGSKGRLLGFVRDTLKPVGLVVGGLLVLVGLALLLVRPRREEPAQGVDGLGTLGSRRQRTARP